MRRPSPRHLRGVAQHPRHVARERMRHPLLLVSALVAASLLVAAGLALPQAQALLQGQAVWSVKCGFSHDAPDDPIVHPGQPGASHLHSFIGNTTTDAASTTANLALGGSTCGKGMDQVDRSAYWVPALLRNGRPVSGSGQRADVYYFVGDKPIPVQPLPLGLRMIAGDGSATSPQSSKLVHYNCNQTKGGTEVVADSATIPSCPAGTYITAKIEFPSCWNGRDLDSPDHRSHMAYPVHGACPADHPVRLPSVGYRIRWLGASGPAWQYSLASGSQFSMHADFWNVWQPGIMRWLVDHCLNAVRNCRDIARDQISAPNGAF